MKIGIDARFVGPGGTGLGKYTEKLIQNLQEIDSKNNYSIFLRKENWNYLNLNKKNFTRILADTPWYSLSEQFKLPGIFQRADLDLLHVPHFNAPIFYRGTLVVTIHDLIHHQFSQESATTRNFLISQAKRIAYKITINSAVKKASKIIVPSECTGKQVVELFSINPSKVIITCEAAEEEYFSSRQLTVASQQVLIKYNIKQPFIIYVGNAYPHKNLKNLVSAIKLISRDKTKINLVIVCGRGVFWERLKKEITDQNLNQSVTLTEYIQSNELPKIFARAKAYIFPSLAEGFGIPGLNAMAAQIPLICSNIPTFREIYGKAAIYFDPVNPEDIASKIKQVLSSDKLKSDLIKKGTRQVKKYSWQKMAKETLKIYRETVNSGLD